MKTKIIINIRSKINRIIIKLKKNIFKKSKIRELIQKIMERWILKLTENDSHKKFYKIQTIKLSKKTIRIQKINKNKVQKMKYNKSMIKYRKINNRKSRLLKMRSQTLLKLLVIIVMKI